MATVFADAVTIYGATTLAGAVTLPAASIGDTQVSAAAPLGVTKTAHQYVEVWSQVSGTAATAATQAFYVAKAAGVVAQVRVGSVAIAIGDSTVTVDVRKNGTTILSGTVQLDNGNTAYVSEAGSLSVTSYSANDVFTVVQTVSAGTGTLPQGVFVQVVFQEAA